MENSGKTSTFSVDEEWYIVVPFPLLSTLSRIQEPKLLFSRQGAIFYRFSLFLPARIAVI